MEKKISSQIKSLLSIYTGLLIFLFVIAASAIASYSIIEENKSSIRAILDVIDDDLNRTFFTIKDDKLVLDELYTLEEDFLIDIMSHYGDIKTIYIYVPINADEKMYLMNIERKEDGTPYSVKEFINMKEAFSDDYNHNERVCYITGKLENDIDIQPFTKYGSTITGIAPIYDSDNNIIAFVGMDIDITDAFKSLLILIMPLFILFIIIGAITGKWGLKIINKRIVKPIQDIEKAAVAFATSEHNGNSKQYHLPVVKNSENELNNLAKSMNKMMIDIDDYITNIAAITAEKERISVELDIATTIQANYIPTIFPPFPEYIAEFDLYASMEPAKEVGGDFYDFFMIDPSHIALVMADVSGKGIPAALFMMISKTIIKNQTIAGLAPEEILSRANKQLCENNVADMFVTVWMGIVDLETGEVKACNAGHKHPAICRKGGKFEFFKAKHGPMLGILPNIKCKPSSFKLEPGDCLFTCTDGVLEATDINEELFGDERTLEALNINPEADGKTLLKTVRQKIDNFVGEAPQFDDITMLSFRYLGKGNSEIN